MAPSRGLTHIIAVQRKTLYTCPCQTSRAFSSQRQLLSGHNRWSKIKHDKGKNDAAKNRQRSIFSQEIATASKLFGPDPNANPRLADLIVKAKREGFAKASIESAIARGQGRSLTGASLEAVTVEGILPNNVAVIVECETDNKLRTLAEVRLVMKDHGGSATPTSYLFTKKGRVVLEQKDGVGLDEVLDHAVEAGALDVVEDEDGKVAVYTEPGETSTVGQAISNALQVQIATSDIFWDPNEDTKVAMASEDAAGDLASFVDTLLEKESTVQAVALNVSRGSLDEEIWKDLRGRLSS